MKPALKHALAAIILALSLAAAVAAGPFEDAAAYDRGDCATALRLLRPLADQGVASAQTRLGFMYWLGQGVSRNYAEAPKWYRLAADQGAAKAQFALGFMYQFGDGVPRNYAEALKGFRLAADQGEAAAQANLGGMYQFGQGVPQSYAEAVKWYRLAADRGNAEAQTNLGFMYADGLGVPQDYVRAHMWFNLSAAQGKQQAARERDNIPRRMAEQQWPLVAARRRVLCGLYDDEAQACASSDGGQASKPDAVKCPGIRDGRGLNFQTCGRQNLRQTRLAAELLVRAVCEKPAYS
jgi:TPR repeat protein